MKMKGNVLIKIAAFGLMLAGLQLLMAGPVKNAVRKLPVTYRTGNVSIYKQRPMISRNTGDLNTNSDVQPEISFFNHLFHYAYRITEGTPLEDQPLELNYRDGDWLEMLGMGWRLTYIFVFDYGGKIPVNILAPEMMFHRGKQKQYVYVDTEEVPVIEQEQLLVSEKFYNNCRYQFQKMKTGAGSHRFVVPRRILRKGKADVEFVYLDVGGKPRLNYLKTAGLCLTFTYEPGSIWDRVKAITLTRDEQTHRNEHDERGGTSMEWRFTYKSAPHGSMQLDYLQNIGIQGFYPTNAVVNLVFSYRALEKNTVRLMSTRRHHGNAADLHIHNNQKRGSIWKKETAEQNNSRWVLPRGMNLAGSPGLRFVDFNNDNIIDIVNGEEGRLDSWLGKKEGGWEYFGHTYKPPRALLKRGGSTPTGSQFISQIHKAYEGNKWKETEGFQTLVTSFYYPVSDTELRYWNAFYFPRIDAHTGKIVAGPWDCDTDPRLQLPVPLQYRGTMHWPAWPMEQEGLKAMEYHKNQGAQLVHLRNRVYLFYCSLCYRDASTGQWLLAPHRQKYSENCRERYTTVWQNNGKTRRVKVYICQAVWEARENIWSKEFPGKTFWKRVDLDEEGQPNGRFILPWNPDPYYHYHYEGFRNVEFVQLRTKTIFAVVRGTGDMNNPIESRKRPTARDIYRFIYKKWERVDTSSYPPDDFFEEPTSFFADVNGDELDDAVIPFSRKVYINLYNPEPPFVNRWQDSPQHYLPGGLGMKYYRLIDLDNDRDKDLFVLDGRTVYINMTKEEKSETHMTLYTDEYGNQCPVSNNSHKKKGGNGNAKTKT